MKFCRNFADIFENVEIKIFLKFLNFLAKIPEFRKNSDRTLIGIVRLVRSLADRTFQLRREGQGVEARSCSGRPDQEGATCRGSILESGKYTGMYITWFQKTCLILENTQPNVKE